MSATATMSRTISPKQLFEKISSGESVNLIDVRTPVEYREIHVSCARNIPLDGLNASQIQDAVAGPVYVICRSGSRGKQGCEKLISGGLSDVINVEGGTLAWEQAGLPVTRGKKCISLERQVRIAAGLMTFAGAVLGYFVHPYWIGLSAFVGAGLTFAGITDTCGMGMILARMPWNQVANGSGASCSTSGFAK